ncbi:MAG TPA: TolC family protein, partial [Tepidisphaeraceae bacterium]|nr:TolC family protein [Tepidisphaeraceae bacterium]
VQVDLRSMLQRTVVNNSDVKVAGFTPAIDETRVTEADARFDPTMFSQLSYDLQRPTISSNSFAGTYTETVTGNVGIRQLLESGGEIRIQAQSQWYNALSAGSLGTINGGDDPFYNNELSVQLTQPLLRDFGNEINRARIVINRNNQQISLLDFRNTLEETLFNAEQSYWQLVQAQREVEIRQLLLERTLQMIQILAIRQDQDVTREQLSRTNQSLELRRSELVAARSRLADVSDDLKRFMNDAQLPIAGPELLVPATPASEVQIIFDPHEQIESGLLNRPELGQQLKRVDNAAVAMGVAKNNLLPRLDLSLQGALQGLDSDFVEATGNVFDKDEEYNGTLQLGLQFEIPIGNRAARAIWRRAQLQHLQSISQYDVQIQQVTVEVKKSLREVDTRYQQIANFRAARLASEDQLDAIQVREDQAEPLTPDFVDRKLRAQESVAAAQSQEAQSVADYNIALARLERAKGTLLRYNNIVLAEEQLPKSR